jgi:hypothetical protein
MFYARLICSDGRCAELFEAYGSCEELEGLVCDCGAALQVLGWPEPLDGEPENAPLDLQLL